MKDFHIIGSQLMSNYKINKPSVAYIFFYFLIQDDVSEDDLDITFYPDSGTQEIIVNTDFLQNELLPSLPNCEEAQIMETHLEEIQEYNYKKRPDHKTAIEDITYISEIIPFIMDPADPRVGYGLYREEADAIVTKENATIQKVGESHKRSFPPLEPPDHYDWEEWLE